MILGLLFDLAPLICILLAGLLAWLVLALTVAVGLGRLIERGKRQSGRRTDRGPPRHR